MIEQGLGVEPATAESISSALRDQRPSWITLPAPDAEIPAELYTALEAFDAGKHPAALAASSWLETQALFSYQTSRTRLLVCSDRIAGFYSLASAQVALSQRDRGRLGIQPVRVPAALVTWLARDAHTKIEGKTLLLHAVATARRAAVMQATTLLVVDAFDDATAMMWRQRFGFRTSAEQGPNKRLWLPLHAEG